MATTTFTCECGTIGSRSNQGVWIKSPRTGNRLELPLAFGDDTIMAMIGRVREATMMAWRNVHLGPVVVRAEFTLDELRHAVEVVEAWAPYRR